MVLKNPGCFIGETVRAAKVFELSPALSAQGGSYRFSNKSIRRA
ncbi:MAG TPA: hypothetical protein VN723_13910 [Rhizomicrobium sp.]|jgi:hypothetical protein|nr:hypothetical protein [Rhizomicrobium sp.]